MYFAVTGFIFLLTSFFSLSDGHDAYYTVCSQAPMSCGNIRNIGYPFWGGLRPQFCGRPEFKLHCKKNNVPFIHLPTTSGRKEYFKPTILHINTSSHTMLLVDGAFSFSDNSCHQDQISNKTLPNLIAPFKYSRLVGNISLFFDCNTLVANNHHLHSFPCNKNNVSSSNSSEDLAYYSSKPTDFDSIGKSCKIMRTFPVLKSELDDLSKGNASLLSVLYKGFEVEYIVNLGSCLACQKSGGICGSTDNSSAKFICYCRHGSHPLVCPKLGRKLWIYLGSGTGGVVILVFLALFAIWYRRHPKAGKVETNSLDRSTSDIGANNAYLSLPHFSYKELEEATANFDQTRELGGGGFGTVYYGKLRDGREVAVKRLYERSFKRVEQFMNEVQILTFLRHQNLVSLYGCTSCHSRELLLVYEYVSNGTVADHLYGNKAKPGSLPWPVRLRIAIETATALSYLHASDIIHRDVKPNNILLDKDYNVKVADFGLSRLFPTDVTHVSTAPQGTPGYLDPEYHHCYRLTDKSDVYSFGVLLIELISSLRAVDMDRHMYEINLSNYAMNKIRKSAFDELVDPQLGFASDFKVRRMTTSVAELAFQCLQHYRDFRPSMDEVLDILKRIESLDYEELQIEEMAKHNLIQNPSLPPTSIEENDVQLSSKHQLSPISVMHIVSSSTTSESTSI